MLAEVLGDLRRGPPGRKAVGLLAATTGAVLLAVLPVAPDAQAAPGDLDPSFSRNGKVLIDFAGGDDAASAVAAQPDGKVVAAGYASLPVGGRAFALVRFDVDGVRDPSFSGNGVVATRFGDGSAAARAIAIEDDGDIVVAGASSEPETGWDFALARYEPDGSLDPSFGQNGRVTTDLGASEGANALALQPDGKLVVAGESGGDFALARYNPDGSLDTSFSGDGIVTTDFAGWGDVAYAVALQDDGRIVAAGSAYAEHEVYEDTPFFALARYQADGTPDSSFSGDGIVITDISDPYGNARAHAVALQQDGKIVLGGATGGGGIFSALVIARYNPSGSPDQSFARVYENYAGARALAIQASGRIVVAGWTWFSESFDFLVTRWDSNGAWDSRFGGPRDSRGRPPGAVADFGLFNTDQARALAIQQDGKIVVAGRSTPGHDHSGGFETDEPGDFALARYRMDGLDPPDADADGVTNDRDLCDRIAATGPDGCPHYARTVTIRYSKRYKVFTGRVSSDQSECEYVPVTVFRNRPGEDVQVGRPSSAYWVRAPRRPGWYYAKVERTLEWDLGVCEGARSPLLRVKSDRGAHDKGAGCILGEGELLSCRDPRARWLLLAGGDVGRGGPG